ncbi:hypothetical protein ABIF68_009525 [Bradyrhizobium japonicum]|uniref:hypothetical protein n=1 Tax=Bradyrhizobium TaxID=374 RepID=UPI0004B5D9DE|nr:MULTISPECIES: hypothetical protein [Bradyrhizobium]MBR0940575.1 hypothetical protein [Bradyrhizobium liaoningense]MDI2071405.1 hypothetical protein [Bradyrhizobium sp. Mp27]
MIQIKSLLDDVMRRLKRWAELRQKPIIGVIVEADVAKETARWTSGARFIRAAEPVDPHGKTRARWHHRLQ